MNIEERLVISLIAAVLTLSVSVYFARNQFRRATLLCVTTPFTTLILLWYYYRNVYNPSQGIAIWILPLVTWWLWWRREYTGRPAISDTTFVLLQVAYSLVYVMIVRLQAF